MKALEKKEQKTLSEVHPAYKYSAKNLLHYRALRQKDLTQLQKQLGDIGLSRLARAENHIIASLSTNRQLIRLLLGDADIEETFTTPEVSIKKSKNQLKKNARSLLGDSLKGRRSRIMVTMPSSAAVEKPIIKEMLQAGMNIARINCAHDDPQVWKNIIQTIKSASDELKIPCLIAMDLGGPKIRTGAIESGPEILKIKLLKNEKGEIIKHTRIWLSKDHFQSTPYHLPVILLGPLTRGKKLFFKDTRHKKRSLILTDVTDDGCWATVKKTSYFESGMTLYANKAMTKTKLTIGKVPAIEGSIYLKHGDALIITVLPHLSKHHDQRLEQVAGEIPIIQCTNSEIIHYIKSGDAIVLDDGKLEGVITSVNKDNFEVRITKSSREGVKLKADKGINFPQSDIKIRGLTDKDISDLDFAAEHADIINMSYVNRPDDVTDLLKAIEKTGKLGKIGIVLKIETENGFKNLTKILLTGMQTYPIGVMIARGDLALEVGWQRFAAIQREIMKLCSAADIPDIWATQVFESLAKNGIPSRAEMTDIWVAQRADCVMLNKGPYIVDAIKMLDSLLCRMNAYHDKNAPMLPSLDKAMMK